MTDPRYDPRYQRGYDGAPPADAPAPAADAVPPTGRETRPVAWQPDAPRRLEPLSPAPADGTAAAFSSAGAVDPAHPAGPDDEPEELDDEFAPAPRRDPYRMALLAASVVLLLAGASLLWQMTRPPDPGATSSYVLVTVGYAVTPALILAGLVGLAMWVALGALRRR